MDTLTRMRAFVDVVEAEGFSAAARKIGRSKALLSKYVRELEDELGTLLINRTTRQFSLTDSGHTYFHRSIEIIREIDHLQEAVRESSRDISGRIKVTAPRTYADAEVGKSLIDFAAAYPDIVLEVRLDDRFVDLVEEGFDVAIRVATLKDSSLIARKLAPFGTYLCASPEFLEKHGTPQTPQDLSALPCIIDTNNRRLSNWAFRNDAGETITVPVKGPIEINSPHAVCAAAVAGLGIAAIPDFIARPDMDAGRLVPILDDRVIRDGGIYAVYPHRRYLPVRVRLFVDFLADWFKDRR